MSTLHASLVEAYSLSNAGNLLAAVKTLSEARQFISASAGAPVAPKDFATPETCRRALREDAPLVWVGEHPDQEVVVAAETIIDNCPVFNGVVDYEPGVVEEEPQQDEQGEEEETDDELLSKIFSLALVMLAQTDGNPLQAAANANNMAMVAADPDQFWGVLGIYMQTFPWITDGLQKAGILASDDE